MGYASEPEQFPDAEPVLERDDPEYVERPRSTRVFAGILTVIMVICVLLYVCWLAGILHE